MIKKFEDKMQKSIESLEREYNSIRAGRANPHVLDKIKVDYYGTPTPLQQVGNISVPEPRIITIQPWETSLLKAIEKEINQTVESGTEKVSVNFEKAKEVAKMLTDLSTSAGDADALTNQYIANIKNICNS